MNYKNTALTEYKLLVKYRKSLQNNLMVNFSLVRRLVFNKIEVSPSLESWNYFTNWIKREEINLFTNSNMNDDDLSLWINYVELSFNYLYMLLKCICVTDFQYGIVINVSFQKLTIN